MTKQEVKTMLETNIQVKKDVIDVLALIKKQTETLKHYKTIDGKYINKLSEVIPVASTWYNDYSKKTVEVKDYYIRKADYSSYGELTLNCNRDYKTRLRFDDSSTKQDNSYYIGHGYKEELTAELMPEAIQKTRDSITDDMIQQENELKIIDSIIEKHNKIIQTLIDFRTYQDTISYTTRSCMPKIELPYVSDRYDILEGF